MQLNESFIYFEKLQHALSPEDILPLTTVCKTLCLPQKVLAVSQYIFLAAKAECRIEPDDIVLISSAVSLACKISETLRPVDKILHVVAALYSTEVDQQLQSMYIEAITRTEIEMCVIIDFNFEITDIYTRLEKLCKEMHLDMSSKKRCWIMLNDMMQTPLPIYFTIDELLICLLFINYGYTELKGDTAVKDEEAYKAFIQKSMLAPVAYKCVKFICSQLLDLYNV